MAIEKILCNPPLAIARLGRSAQPVDAYQWVANSNPHVTGETQIKPAWTLDVQPDGRVSPRKPGEIRLRDVQGIRPVAPFIEVWCVLSGSPTPQPLTEDLLRAEGLALNDLGFTVDAVNRKAARRTFNDDLAYGTFPPLAVRGDDHQVHDINAVSPRSVPPERRLIPDTRAIALGSFQVIRPTASDAPRASDWPPALNLNTVRVRFTPGRGECFGPAGQATPAQGVPAKNAFLNDAAGWFDARVNARPGQPRIIQAFAQPWDTFAGAENNSSLGIVDDTCDVRLTVTLAVGQGRNQTLTAAANIFSGPADFSPDSRPFVSLADALLDRDGDSEARNVAMSRAEKDAWVEDLFERAYEHVALMNVDVWRHRLAGNRTLTPEESRPVPIPNDETALSDAPMGGRDRLRDGAVALPAASSHEPLPITQRARERHRYLSDRHTLENLVKRDPARLPTLVRKPFQESEAGFTMKMPAFMRGSNGAPLTLSVAQYDLLMIWVEDVLAQHSVPSETLLATAANITESAARAISERARTRRTHVLDQLTQEE